VPRKFTNNEPLVFAGLSRYAGGGTRTHDTRNMIAPGVLGPGPA
jgi:hypothetical protein